MADECQDVSSQEELSICCRWIVNSHPEEHFMTVLHVTSTSAEAITKALTSYIEEKGFDYRKLVGQAYHGATTFAGVHTGVQKRIRTHSGHALYIHCACHKLQLASKQAAERIPEMKRMFGMMTNLWKLFYYLLRKLKLLKKSK